MILHDQCPSCGEMITIGKLPDFGETIECPYCGAGPLEIEIPADLVENQRDSGTILELLTQITRGCESVADILRAGSDR